jgi:hypothetical protein
LILAVALAGGCGDLRNDPLTDGAVANGGGAGGGAADASRAGAGGAGGGPGIIGTGGTSPAGAGNGGSSGPVDASADGPAENPPGELDGPALDQLPGPGPDSAGMDSAPPATCAPSMRRCDDGCFPMNDPKHCGAGCAACREPAGGSATCDGTLCALACSAGYLHCYPGMAGETCAARTRGFESGTNEGFHFFNSRTGVSDYNVMQVSAVRGHSGARSLAYRMTDTASFEWVLNLCGDPMGKGFDLRGRTLTFWYYLDTPGPPSAFAHIWARVGNTSDVYDDVLFPRVWSRVSMKLADVPDNATDFVALQFTGGSDLADAGQATFFLDDVTIE